MDAKLFEKAEKIKANIRMIDNLMDHLKYTKREEEYLSEALRDIDDYNISKRLQSKVKSEIDLILIYLNNKKIELEKEFKSL